MRAALLHLTCVLLLLTWSSERKTEPPAPVPPPQLSSADFSPRHPIRLRDLLAGQRLGITILSHGCFHFLRADLELTLDRTAALRLDGVGAPVGRDLVQLPTKYLSVKEVRGLDRALDRYRQPSTGICTSDTEVSLSLYDGSRLLNVERYHDRSCAHGDPPEIDFLSLVFSPLSPLE